MHSKFNWRKEKGEKHKNKKFKDTLSKYTIKKVKSPLVNYNEKKRYIRYPIEIKKRLLEKTSFNLD